MWSPGSGAHGAHTGAQARRCGVQPGMATFAGTRNRSDDGALMGTGTPADDGYRFVGVAAVLDDPFGPDVDPEAVALPSVPALRSPEDDQVHHRRYWQAHVWASLHRYRRAFSDPHCPPARRGDYPRVAADALLLAERVTARYPLVPMDSVACHAALKDLHAGSVALAETVAALRGPTPLPVPSLDATERETEAATGVQAPDFFAPSGSDPPVEMTLSLRGFRGLRRNRRLPGHVDETETPTP